MTTLHNNGATPSEPDHPSGPSSGDAAAAALRQQEIETYIRTLVDARVQEILREKGQTAAVQQGQGATIPPGDFVSKIAAGAPAIAQAFISALDAWARVKILSNPVGHLDVIAQAYPRLLALYSPNPLGEQFTSIYANAFTQGMRAALVGKGAAILPAPLAPEGGSLPLNPNPSPTPSTTEKPSASTLPSGGLGRQPAGGISTTTMQNLTDEEFAAMVESLREEYTRRRSHA